MIDYIKSNLEKKVTPQLYDHIINVAQTAKDLAHHYGIDEEACYIAGLMHDYCKQENLSYTMIDEQDQYRYLETAPQVWHGYVASYIAHAQYKINNQDILNAIKYHTTSHPDLCAIGQILYIADTIEPNRNYPGIDELRTYEDTLHEHYYKVLTHSVTYLQSKDIVIGELTLQAIENKPHQY